MSDAIISVENLGKKYRISHQGERQRYVALRDVIAQKCAAPFLALFGNNGKASGSPRETTKQSSAVELADANRNGDADHLTEDFWALKNVSFEVKQGEVLGIIGRNGAGKSTLLKILSRITEPTEGRVTLRGRVASLLEVGTGFHPELTGRENIFLNGAILGMSRAEIRKKFDEIVAFAEVEKFLDTPVKRYSSGMYVRLAFAVAAHLEPEILIVDEVLAVGDAEFQKKCLGKMQTVSREDGRTVLFVSHNMAAIRSLCGRALLLRSGEVQFCGGVAEAFNQYSQQSMLRAGATWLRPSTLPLPALGFDTIRVALKGTQPQLRLECDVKLRSGAEAPRVFIAVDICDRSLAPIMQALPSTDPFIQSANGLCNLVMEIDLPPLVPGCYALDFWIGTHFSKTTDYVKHVATFEVTESPTESRSFSHSGDHGFLVPVSRCRVHETTSKSEK
jgi:lipopolysaccharide transport system ATP-binding protein